MSDENVSTPYSVGPGCPPLETRWKKGCPSPNPNGRPPKRKNGQDLFRTLDPLAQAVLDFDNHLVTKRTPDGDVEITRRQAALEKLFKEAMGANYRALALYLGISRAAQEIQNAHRLDLATKAQAYRDAWLPRFLAAERAGVSLPDQYPDPRDIEILEDLTVIIHGPANAEGRRLMDQVILERDRDLEILAQIQDDARLSRHEETRQILKKLKRMIARINKALPPRCRRTA